MKKYNKPTLNIEELSSLNTIANNISENFGPGFNEDNIPGNDHNFEDFWN